MLRLVFIALLLPLAVAGSDGDSTRVPSHSHQHDHRHNHDHDHGHDHDHDWSQILRPIERPRVDYQILGVVDIDSHLIRAEMDVFYRNDGNDTVRVIEWGLGDSSLVCTLDSILYQAAPIDSSLMRQDSTALHVTLPRPLLPGDDTQFLVAFRSMLTCPPYVRCPLTSRPVLVNWHPRILSRFDTCTSCRVPRAAEPARFRVGLQVDTSVELAAPAWLMNERELYGFLPQESKADTIYDDITDGRFMHHGNVVYDPVFDGGLKRYMFRAETRGGFPLVVHRKNPRDRVFVDSLVVDVFRDTNLIDPSSVAIGRRVLAGYVSALGMPPVRRPLLLSRVAGGDAQGVVGLPPFEFTSDVRQALTALSLAELWFPDLAPNDVEASAFRRAFIWYISIRVLGELPGMADGRAFLSESMQFYSELSASQDLEEDWTHSATSDYYIPMVLCLLSQDEPEAFERQFTDAVRFIQRQPCRLVEFRHLFDVHDDRACPDLRSLMSLVDSADTQDKQLFECFGPIRGDDESDQADSDQ